MATCKVKDTHWWWSITCFSPSYGSRNQWHKLLLSRGEVGAWSTVPRSSDFQSFDSWNRWLFSIAWLGESLIVAVSAFSLTETRHIALKWPGQTIPTTNLEVLVNIFEKKNIVNIFEKKIIVCILPAILGQTNGFMERSLSVMGRIIENMAGGRELLNILLRQNNQVEKLQKQSLSSALCVFDFFGGEGVGWSKSFCHNYFRPLCSM